MLMIIDSTDKNKLQILTYWILYWCSTVEANNEDSSNVLPVINLTRNFSYPKKQKRNFRAFKLVTWKSKAS